jgi:hypothetical protein
LLDGRYQRSSESDDNVSESSWTDTGDIAEQLADEDDPVRKHLDDEILTGVLKKHPRYHHPRRSGKQIRYHAQHFSPSTARSGLRHTGAVSKDAIHIPEPAPRRVSWAERSIAGIMTGGTSSIHGLTGKPLLFVAWELYFPP